MRGADFQVVTGVRVTKRKAVTTAERNLVIKYAKQCLREITRRKHELPVSYSEAVDNLRVIVNCSHKRSYGGTSYISIDVHDFRIGDRTMLEYDRHASDPTIGTRTFDTPEQALACLVAHEVAHHIQYAYGPRTRWLRKRYRKPHGDGWQAIYRILRREVVNPTD